MDYFFFLSLILINIFLFKISSHFFSILGIIDKPDNKLKKHKKTVVYNGGTVFFINFLIIFSYLNIFSDEKNSVILILFFFLIYLIGLLDDIINIQPTLRFVLLVIILFIFIKNFNSFNLEVIKFKDIDFVFIIKSAGIIFTIFSLLAFIQASNMIDGINLQFGIYILALIFYLNSFVINFTIYLIPVLVIFLFFNYKNKSFFGDSGSYVCSFLFGALFIYYYNKATHIGSDDIVVAMLIPGIDMVRLFFTRINLKKSPFAGDRNHLHHLILEKYSENYAILISPLLMISPMILKIFLANNILVIFLSVIIYSSTIIFLKAK